MQTIECQQKTIAAVVVNDQGYILPYTVRSTMSQCEEFAIELWGEELWKKLQSLGAHVVCTHYEEPTGLKPGKKVNYNPYKDDWFKLDGEDIFEAKRVIFRDGGCFLPK